MRFSPVARFAAACALFAVWLGYLIWLAATSSKPVVLSRPQLLVSEIDVVAQVDSLGKPVTVEEILSARITDKNVKPGAQLAIANLADCKRLPREGEDPETIPLDWTGPGQYLLPLRTAADGRSYVVCEIPPSPGFPPRHVSQVTPRIYPIDDKVLRQHKEIRETR